MPPPNARLADLPVAPPFFLRKLLNAEAWGDPATPPDVRVAETLPRVFMVTDPAQSLFLVTSAPGLNGLVTETWRSPAPVSATARRFVRVRLP